MAGNYLRGALIAFTDSFPRPVPKVVAFQYNPETMTHGWTVSSTAPIGPGAATSHVSQLAVSGPPVETFSFTLAMDANDTIADGDPVAAGIAAASGIYNRLAALEMLMFPLPPKKDDELVGTYSAAKEPPAQPPSRKVPAGDLPLVMFVWGPGRIVPVRVMSFSVTEKLFDSHLLHPVHAEAQVGLRAITADELSDVSAKMKPIAQAATAYMQKLRQSLALADISNGVDSIIGMLPI